DTRPEVQGRAEAGSTVKVYDNGTLLGSAVADKDGNWSFTPAANLKDGDHRLTAEAVDAAGNVSPPSGGFDFTLVSGGAPDAPDVTVSDSAGNTVAAGGSTVDNTPTLSGEGEPGDVVTVTDGDRPLGSTVVGEDGSWSLTPETPLDEGEHDLGVTVTDPAGNESPATVVPVIVDTTAPEAPSISAVLDDQGDRQGALASGDITDDTRPEVQGRAEAGSTVKVYDNGTLLGSAVADRDGNWSFTPAANLKDGDHRLTAEAVDAAGNVSPPSGGFDFTLVSGGAPEAPVI
ncbi:hypothetical protein GIX45_20355, partial [Erwinia sp. CPCC 100877]|nr:hypothetical protein [Erwinia sp. CPCC 100877]